ncbi:serine/threonine-protein kinase Nek2 isoform X1 [Strongylocentrotus purpuratus]|uniref:Serine/threonine-protein kinase Nek2 n=1 Tax=Strongylocentrotus purpuratus TaxID=7668 RepID=A0A7M7RCB8_STRPU|nr:serine/threonine-protein kinase Nek2 isoform X1 [Strongylocentrotus purpuratus]|eukprot:XP_786794.1 PREDICTED: serine/threonine-protein kinase Nek2 [Strongylocentrotus purpuratus]
MPSKLSDYDILYTIGSGSYGKCRKVRRKSDGKILVSKEIDYGTMGEVEKQMLVSEVNLLRELKHEFIVRYYDRIVDRATSTIYIIMEYCEGGDLGSLISKCKKDRKFLEESFAWKIFQQLTIALQECHRRGKGRAILHRDLKPANVFLDADHNVKLGDFGLARVLQHDTSFAKTFVGTPYYMSPEQMNRLSYNDKSDIWSLGCLLYELCSLSPPFTATNQAALAVKIKGGHFRRLPVQYSSDLNEIVSSMLKVKPSSRPSIDELLADPRLSPPPSQVSSADAPKEAEVDLLKKEREALLAREESLKLKERNADKRTQMLNDREKELDLRERSLAARERLVKDKMSRAEELIEEHEKQQKQIPKVITRVTELRRQKEYLEGMHPTTLKTKKHVHFQQGKENNPASHEGEPAVPSADSKMTNLKERLYQAKLRGLALRKAEMTSKLKSKQLLSLR